MLLGNPLAVEPVREYVRRARPAYVGDGDEPLFLTDDGRAFSREGWAGMAQRIRRRLAEEGIAFKQHRLRSTCARRLHEAGYPDSAVIEDPRLEFDGDAPAIPRQDPGGSTEALSDDARARVRAGRPSISR